jgi:hypothetical protein
MEPENDPNEAVEVPEGQQPAGEGNGEGLTTNAIINFEFFHSAFALKQLSTSFCNTDCDSLLGFKSRGARFVFSPG